MSSFYYMAPRDRFAPYEPDNMLAWFEATDGFAALNPHQGGTLNEEGGVIFDLEDPAEVEASRDGDPPIFVFATRSAGGYDNDIKSIQRFCIAFDLLVLDANDDEPKFRDPGELATE